MKANIYNVQKLSSVPSANKETLLQENLPKLGENSESGELQPPTTSQLDRAPLTQGGHDQGDGCGISPGGRPPTFLSSKFQRLDS